MTMTGPAVQPAEEIRQAEIIVRNSHQPTGPLDMHPYKFASLAV